MSSFAEMSKKAVESGQLSNMDVQAFEKLQKNPELMKSFTETFKAQQDAAGSIPKNGELAEALKDVANTNRETNLKLVELASKQAASDEKLTAALDKFGMKIEKQSDAKGGDWNERSKKASEAARKALSQIQNPNDKASFEAGMETLGELSVYRMAYLKRGLEWVMSVPVLSGMLVIATTLGALFGFALLLKWAVTLFIG